MDVSSQRCQPHADRDALSGFMCVTYKHQVIDGYRDVTDRKADVAPPCERIPPGISGSMCVVQN